MDLVRLICSISSCRRWVACDWLAIKPLLVLDVEPGVHVLIGLIEGVALVFVVKQRDCDKRLSKVVSLVPGEALLAIYELYEVAPRAKRGSAGELFVEE